MEETVEPRIVEAVGTAVHASDESRTGLAKEMENAMSKAVLQALADGVAMSDTEEILRRKMAARQEVLDAYNG